jgi:chemotaxis protein MotB
LDEIYKIAARQNLYLRVAGHTDDVPISTEEFPSNWELSTKRAIHIVRYLLEKKGMPAERIFAEGFAQYQPLVEGGDPEARKQNRRIEIYVESSSGRSFIGESRHHVQKSE